jgi:hypothetical protein
MKKKRKPMPKKVNYLTSTDNDSIAAVARYRDLNGYGTFAEALDKLIAAADRHGLVVKNKV